MLNKNNYRSYLKENFEFIKNFPDNIWEKIYEFEELFSNYYNSIASTCSSWSTALFLSLKSIWISSWDEVLTNVRNFIAVPNSILISWAKPVFLDIWKSINEISLDYIKSKININTKAIILVHLLWYPIENIFDIVDYCKSKWIIVIEDCCQSIWAEINNRKIWTIWDIWVFSLDSHKMVKWWEWWIVISRKKDFIREFNLLKNNHKEDWLFTSLWYNFRYNDFSAIYAIYSFRNLWNLLNQRRKLIKKIEVFLNKNFWNQITLLEWNNTNPSFYWILLQLNNNLFTKDELLKKNFYDININLYPNLLNNNWKILEYIMPYNTNTEFDFNSFLSYIKENIYEKN